MALYTPFLPRKTADVQPSGRESAAALSLPLGFGSESYLDSQEEHLVGFTVRRPSLQ
jgi:hypothetical protein